MLAQAASPLTAPPAGLLRVSTAGSVDDGKSTLIGRLLYETKSIFEDHLAEVERASRQHGADYVNLALLTDGLRAEREQGITIDVAYRFFATPRRRFIVADTPGHVQYTRNMVTGASTADVAIVLVDASRGVTEQSRRHLAIAALLRVPHVVVCINKMDLVGYEQAAFDALRHELAIVYARLDLADVTVIPIAALHGDNVVADSTAMPWHTGPTLLDYLEAVPLVSGHQAADGRFPVQWVNRPLRAEHHDFRGYAGQVAGGVLRPGDAVLALPAGLVTRIRSIETFDGPLEAAYPPLSVTLTLEDDIDLSRGDMLCSLEQPPLVGQAIEATLCWLMPTPLRVNGRYVIKHTTRTARAVVASVHARLDVSTLTHETARTLTLNEIGRVTLRTTTPLFYDPSQRNRVTSSFILVDEYSNETVAAGIITGPAASDA
ncbi:MAG: 50S ribosome-binding GTPase [Chloroflexi bacterium]|nr:50S ribosome-binding GTPase [Chloroflexota bacterium]